MPTFRTDPAEPVTMFEIFLPKRMEYQSKLYEALQGGLQLENVRAFLRGADREDEQRRIKALIPESVTAKYTDLRIQNLQQVYFGFSLYEVDGVFVTDPRDPATHRMQERTQVVRLFFKPDAIYESIRTNPSLIDPDRNALLDEVRQFQRTATAWNRDDAVSTYLQQRNIADESGTLRLGLHAIEEWHADILLFVFGYVVGKITEELAIDESEIWVTSHHGMVVNVVRRIE